MAYPDSFLRLVLSGSLYTSEAWSMGFSLMRNFAPSASPPAEVPPAVVTAAGVMIGNGNISNAVRLDLIKLNLIGTDGRYVDQGDTVFHEYTSPVPGGSTGRPAPQVAMAVTLRTANRRGLAHAGRVYIPGPAHNPSDDGRLTASGAEIYADAVATFINSVNAALPDWRVCVASDVREGAFRQVEGVECGRVLDTIRSRRTSLDEARVPSQVAIAT